MLLVVVWGFTTDSKQQIIQHYTNKISQSISHMDLIYFMATLEVKSEDV